MSRDRYRRVRAAIRKADRFRMKGKARRAFLARGDPPVLPGAEVLLMRGSRCKQLRRAFRALHGRSPAKARVIGMTPIALGFLAGLRAFFQRKLTEAGKDGTRRENAKRAAEAVFHRVDFAPSEWRRLKKAYQRRALP